MTIWTLILATHPNTYNPGRKDSTQTLTSWANRELLQFVSIKAEPSKKHFSYICILAQD